MHRAIACAVALALAGSPRGQADDANGVFRFDKSTGSIPVFTQAPAGDVLDLSAVVHKLSPSIFLVGFQDQEGDIITTRHGTAFVISKEHRLLATNAHVADIMYETGGDMVAIGNETSNVYKVEKAYYHPGVWRATSDGLAVRTSEPSIGEVDPNSPDVAVLQLAPGEPLPDALPMATPQEWQDLLAKPVAMLGYPGYDLSWPKEGGRASATYGQGIVCRVSTFANDANAPNAERQQIHHSMADWFGFSGSPMFLKNGHVIALNNAGMTLSKKGLVTNLAYGVRIDCLWELLKQRGLWEQVSIPADPATVDIDRYTGPGADAAVELLNRVRRLLAMARIDVSRKDETAAIAKCTEAQNLLPTYGPIYDVRANAYSFLAFKMTPRSADSKKYWDLAYEDAKKAKELEPASLDHYLDEATAHLNAATATMPTGYATSDDYIELAKQIIGKQGVRSKDRAYAYRVHSFAQGFAHGSLGDLEKAVEVDPWIPQNYATLMVFWQNYGENAAAQRAKEMYETLSTAQADSDQAWLAATSTDEDHRNGTEAERLAKKACQATDFKWWEALRSLAAAEAENGDFDRAVKHAKQAVELAPDEESDALHRQLKSYSKKKLWRED